MSNYPWGYPDNRLIVGGVDITANFQLILIDGFVLNPPEPKVYEVEIPGGNGVIDLTESLNGDVVYNNREQDFTFKAIYPADFESTKSKLSNFLHGKYFEYQLTWDMAYTYKGRFSVSSYSHIGLAKGQLGEIVVHVSADPYKYLEDQVFRINASGGQHYYMPSGRKPVRPVISTTRATNIVWKDTITRVGVGTFRLNNVLFQEGINEIYFNTYEIFVTKWDDIGKGGQAQMTWNEAKKYTYDQISRLTLESGTPATNPNTYKMNKIAPYAASSDGLDHDDTPVNIYGNFFMESYSWDKLIDNTWNYCKENKWTWEGLNYDPGSSANGGTASSGGTQLGSGEVPDLGGAVAIITYEWGDL